MGKDPERGKYTLPEGSRTWEYLSAIFCATGGFSIGIVTGWNSPSLNELRAPNSPIPITPEEASTLTASLSIGHLIAFPMCVFLVDRLGRRSTIMLASVPMIISWGIIAIVKNFWALILARMMGGISLGLIMSTTPIHMTEILSADIRGSLGAIGGIMGYLGVFFMFGVAPKLGMQITAFWCIGFALIFLISYWFIPESPYFLVMVGRVEEAERALKKLRGKTDVADEIELIKTTLREKGKSLIKSHETEGKGATTEKQSAFKQLFTIRGNVKAFIIGLILTTMMHLSGYHTIFLYCHIILTDMGSGISLYVATNVFIILQIVAAGCAIFVVDKFGRRTLVLSAGMICVVLVSVIATYFFLMEHMNLDVSQYSIIPLGSVIVLAMALNIGFVSVLGTLQAEIYAAEVKMLGHCITGLTGSMMTIGMSKSYLLMAASWGLGHSIPFYGFAVSTFICTVLLAWLLPETKGKTFLEIQRNLNA